MRIDDEALRRKLLPEAVISDPVPGGLTPAAVLVTLHEEAGEDWLLLTKRTETLREHKGQIAFPGGKFDPKEDRHLVDTALRESWEEVGLLPDHVEVFGSLAPFDTISSYLLYPFVGRFPWPYDLRANPDEISELIRIPLKHLLLPETYRTSEREYLGQTHKLHFYDYEHTTVWGITGYILHEFLKLL